MIITEYMENGSLDAFLRVCDYFILNPRMLVFRTDFEYLFCLVVFMDFFLMRQRKKRRNRE